jgi:hypothetical protein
MAKKVQLAYNKLTDHGLVPKFQRVRYGNQPYYFHGNSVVCTVHASMREMEMEKTVSGL